MLEKKQIIDQSAKEKRINEIIKMDVQRAVRAFQGQEVKQLKTQQAKQKRMLTLVAFSNLILGFQQEKKVIRVKHSSLLLTCFTAIHGVSQTQKQSI